MMTAMNVPVHWHNPHVCAQRRFGFHMYRDDIIKWTVFMLMAAHLRFPKCVPSRAVHMTGMTASCSLHACHQARPVIAWCDIGSVTTSRALALHQRPAYLHTYAAVFLNIADRKRFDPVMRDRMSGNGLESGRRIRLIGPRIRLIEWLDRNLQ